MVFLIFFDPLASVILVRQVAILGCSVILLGFQAFAITLSMSSSAVFANWQMNFYNCSKSFKRNTILFFLK